jgi:PAS domain-containing protein
VISAVDITERKRTQQELRASEELYRLAAEALQGAVYEWDSGRDEVRWSEGLRRVLGFAPDEGPAKLSWWQARIHPEDVPAFARLLFPESLDHESVRSVDLRVEHRNRIGSICAIAASSSAGVTEAQFVSLGL